MTRTARLAFLAVSVGTIGWFTLTPAGRSATWTEGPCCLATDLVLNVLLFVPFGLALRSIGTRALLATGIGAITSGAIEIAQLWIPGRIPSVHDVVTNALGTILGTALALGWPERERWSRTVGRAVAFMVILGWFLGSFLVHPAAPRARTWWGQWAHEFGGTVEFPGQVKGFMLNGVTIPDGAVEESSRLNRLLAGSDTIRVSASVISGPRVVGRAQVAGIVANGPGGEFLGLWQEGTDLLAFVRLRLSDASLRNAWLRLDGAFPDSPGRPVGLSATVTPDRVILASNHGGRRREAGYRLSADFFWASLLPFHPVTGKGLAASTGLVVALGFGAVGMGLRSRGTILLLAPLGVVGGPLLAGTAMPRWSTLVVAWVGVESGRFLARRLGLLR